MLRELSALLEQLTDEIVKYDTLYNQIKLFFIQLFSCQIQKSLPASTITLLSTLDSNVSNIINSMNCVSIISMLKLFSNWGLVQPDIRAKFQLLVSELENSETRIIDVRTQLLSSLSGTRFVDKFENWSDYRQYTDFITDAQLASDTDMFIREQATQKIHEVIARVKSNTALFQIDKYYLIGLCQLAGIDCTNFDFNILLKTDETWRITQFIEFLDWILS